MIQPKSSYDPIALFYDHLIPDPPGMVQFYVQLARAAGASEVLEIGCGTGRQSLALARAGVCVTAVDISAEMLAVLRAKMRRFGNAIATITLVRADQRSIVLGRRFPLVLATGGTIQHALTAADWHQALCRMRDHVAPDGRIAFDVAAADRRLAEGRFRRNYRAFSAAFLTPRWTRVESWDDVCHDPITGITQTISTFAMCDENGQATDRLSVPFRQTFPSVDEICNWMIEAGFANITVRGGFYGEAVGDTGDLLFTARLAGAPWKAAA